MPKLQVKFWWCRARGLCRSPCVVHLCRSSVSFSICCSAFVVQHLLFTHHLLFTMCCSFLSFTICCSPFVCRSAFVVQHLSFSICCSPFVVRLLSFAISCSPCVVHHVLFSICCSAFVVRHFLFAVCCSPCVVHLCRSPFVVHQLSFAICRSAICCSACVVQLKPPCSCMLTRAAFRRSRARVLALEKLYDLFCPDSGRPDYRYRQSINKYWRLAYLEEFDWEAAHNWIREGC